MDLERADRAPCSVAHVLHVDVEHAGLEIAAGLQNTLAFEQCGPVRGFGGGGREAEDDRGEEAMGEGERRCDATVVDVPVVGKGLPLATFVAVRVFGRVRPEVVD